MPKHVLTRRESKPAGELALRLEHFHIGNNHTRRGTMRVIITSDPYIDLDRGRGWSQRGVWPCKWVSCKDAGPAPFVSAYRRRFSIDEEAVVRAHVSADERYELFVDGVRIGRGSERGDANNWFYETYDIALSEGEHVIVARVWSLAGSAPYAQMTVSPGFIFSTEGKFIELLGTGVAQWETKKLAGYEFTNPSPAWGTGANLAVHGDSFSWGFETGDGDGWAPVVDGANGCNGFIRNEFGPVHLMMPATLPPMLEQEVCAGSVRFVADVPAVDTRPIAVRQKNNLTSELDSWNLIHGKGSITVPPNTKRRAIIDLENYYCAYPEIMATGGRGGSIRVLWAESLYEKSDGGAKGNRNEIDGKHFWGVGDTFFPDGGANRRFDTLWWQAGRYVEVLVQTADEPLTIDSFRLRETHYPADMQSRFASSEPRLERVTPIMLRGLQMCSHETYMDCPYYEQLQYVGDTRLEVLTTYAVTRDDRLPRKALRMFDVSRRISGITQSRYPSRVTQIIPPFSLWWVGMVYDYSIWRDGPDYVRGLMPGVRAVLDCFRGYLNSDGLVESPNGWNYMDWVPGWGVGMPPQADRGVSGVINWQFVLALAMAAELEEQVGEFELAARSRRHASELASRLSAAFWDDSRRLYADDLSKQHFSEHAQCLAILSGQLNEDRKFDTAHSLVSDPDLARTTIYFTHYLFETYRVLGRMDKLFERLKLWFDLETNGFKTTFEEPEPSRSDCHAWGAHPIYHYFATILGIRPASPGFRTVRIEPQLGPLTGARGVLVHPAGEISVDFAIDGGRLTGSATLPEGVTGTLLHDDGEMTLGPGKTEL